MDEHNIFSVIMKQFSDNVFDYGVDDSLNNNTEYVEMAPLSNAINHCSDDNEYIVLDLDAYYKKLQLLDDLSNKNQDKNIINIKPFADATAVENKKTNPERNEGIILESNQNIDKKFPFYVPISESMQTVTQAEPMPSTSSNRCVPSNEQTDIKTKFICSRETTNSSDSSDEEVLSEIKRRKEFEKLHNVSLDFTKDVNYRHRIVDASPLSIDNIRNLDQPTRSNSGGFSKFVKIKPRLEDEDSIGYHSSDFEFISEDECERVGIIVSSERKVKDMFPKTSESEHGKNMFKKLNDENRSNHVIPRGVAFENMFRIAPMYAIFMENKSSNSSIMKARFDGIGYDMNWMHGYYDIHDAEHLEQARFTAEYMQRTYPQENRKRRRFL